jgi:hypothetical protein
VNSAPDFSDPAPTVSNAADDGPPSLATVYLEIELSADTMPGSLADIKLALADAARRMTRSGHPVRYLNCMYMPARTRLLCVFAAESEEAVHATVEQVRLPFVQIKSILGRWNESPAPEEGEPGL